MQLSVYTASAGAGKTHKLTGEFLLLSLSRPGAFRHIQAVTFTNKAMAEMKERFVKELHTVATVPEESAFTDELCEKLGISVEELQKKAGETLHNVMNDYDAFRVKTIDAFFQEVIRAFARELNLPSHYRLEMDAKIMLDLAATRLLDSLDHNPDMGKEQKKELIDWLKEIAEEQIEQGRNSNIKAGLIRIGKELFSERFKQNSVKIISPEEFKELKQRCHSSIAIFEKKRQQQAGQLLELLNDAGRIPQERVNKNLVKGLEKLLRKPKETELAAAIRNVGTATPALGEWKEQEKGILKAATKNSAQADGTAIDEIRSLIINLYNYTEKEGKDYASARAILKNLNTFALISALQEQLNRISSENNVSLITDATQFINRIIDGCEIPFIYEKLGAQIHHHMLDEFQDTSRLQYDNFKPLLKESLDKQYGNLIVGDVKQSIYRFRNSDSSLLSGQVPADFSHYVREYNLDRNWRSVPEIIRFNNAFYKSFAEHLEQLFNEEYETALKLFTETYSQVEQQVPASHKEESGAVVVHYLPEETDEADEMEPLDEAPAADIEGVRLQDLCETIYDITRRGYSQSDIAILVRTNRDAEIIADAILKYRTPEGESIQVVSAEALKVRNSAAVRLIIAALCFISGNTSETPLNTLRLQEAYRVSYETLKRNDPQTAVGASVDTEKIAACAYLNVAEAAEMIINIFEPLIPEGEWPYVLKLLDLIAGAQADFSADIKEFLDLWETRLNKETIPESAAAHAVTIMTLHKSKGLGFLVVLMPFLDFSVRTHGSNDFLWCDISKFDNRFDFEMPVEYNKQLLDTVFKQYYIDEVSHMLLDQLNVLYVGTTRAKRELHLWIKQAKQDKQRVTRFESMIQSCLTSLNETDEGNNQLFLSKQVIDNEMPPLPYLPTGKQEKEDKKPNETIRLKSIGSNPVRQRIGVLMEGRDFFKEDNPRRLGRIMHLILQEIEQPADIPEAIEAAMGKGLITYDRAEMLKKELLQMMENPTVASWFNGKDTLLREQAIIGREIEGSRRPDRILIHPDGSATVIDYKFGAYRSKKHFMQVREYMQLLAQMGYSPIKGFLWYVALDEITPVKIDKHP